MAHGDRRTSWVHSPRPWRTLGHYAHRAFAAGAAAIALVLAMTNTMALAQMTRLSGNHPLEARKLASHAPAGQTNTINAIFGLRNQPALKQMLGELQDPASPRYRQWLTPAEFDARFGRTPAEVQAVRKWLESQGFTVTKTSAREIVASGTVAHAESAVATKIASSGDGRFYGNISDPLIPPQFASVI